MKEEDKNKILFINKNGWPIESIKGHRIISFMRRLIYTRKIERYEDFYQRTGIIIRFD